MISRPKKVLIVSGDVNGGLTHQRLHLPLRHLWSDGLIDVKCASYDDVRNVSLAYTDVVVMCHSWSPMAQHIVERAKVHHGLQVIQDLDDLLHDLPTDHPEHAYSSQQRVAQVLQASDKVVFATDYLRDAYGHLTRWRTVIPNSVSKRIYEAYKPLNKPHKNCFIVGWSGGQSHKPDQDTLLPGLREFLLKYQDAKAYFHVLCPDQLYREFGARIIFEPQVVDFLDFPAVAAAYPFSVWTVPLNDNNFNNAKSDMKLVESAPNCIPLIASPRADFIKHFDKNIMLFAEDNSAEHKSWFEQLEWAYHHQEEIELMGERARDYVLSERTSDKVAARWKEVLEV